MHRLVYANENLDQILHSASHPFENVDSSWWVDSDEPWQTLAACMEIRNALNSPCPEEFVSHLPIHQVHCVTVRDENHGWLFLLFETKKIVACFY